MNFPSLTLSALRMLVLSGIFVRNLMSASKISWRSKQSLVTATCLKHSQETISTILWGRGAMKWGSLTKILKREECRDVNFPSLTLSALRKQDLSGISNDNSMKIDYVYFIGLFLFFFMADFGTLPSFSQTSLLLHQTQNCCCCSISTLLPHSILSVICLRVVEAQCWHLVPLVLKSMVSFEDEC